MRKKNSMQEFKYHSYPLFSWISFSAIRDYFLFIRDRRGCYYPTWLLLSRAVKITILCSNSKGKLQPLDNLPAEFKLWDILPMKSCVTVNVFYISLRLFLHKWEHLEYFHHKVIERIWRSNICNSININKDRYV